jgi:hypothetical protein
MAFQIIIKILELPLVHGWKGPRCEAGLFVPELHRGNMLTLSPTTSPTSQIKYKNFKKKKYNT